MLMRQRSSPGESYAIDSADDLARARAHGAHALPERCPGADAPVQPLVHRQRTGQHPAERVLRLEPQGFMTASMRLVPLFQPPVGYVAFMMRFRSTLTCSLKLIVRLPEQRQLAQH